jgi:hypothetical protein
VIEASNSSATVSPKPSVVLVICSLFVLAFSMLCTSGMIAQVISNWEICLLVGSFLLLPFSIALGMQ